MLQIGYESVFLFTAATFLLNALIVFVMHSHTSSTPAKRSHDVQDNAPTPGMFGQLRDLHWASQWDLMLLRLVQSCIVILYRSNFNWLLEEQFGATADTIGHVTSLQVELTFLLPQSVRTGNRRLHHGLLLRLDHRALLDVARD